MNTRQIKKNRWAIMCKTGKKWTLIWNHNYYRDSPHLWGTRKTPQVECGWQNRSHKNAGKTFRPVRVSVVITEIKTKKGKK